MSTDILFKAMPGQINIDEAKGIVECFVAGVGNKDSVGDIVLPGAFAGSLKRRKPRVVWGHDWNQPIGKVLEIYEVPASDARLPGKMKQAGIGGLFARVQFNLRSERGREAFASVAFFGEEQEWSIGYKTLDAVYDNERKANLLREVELYEVSPVLHGANQLTGTISVKSENQDQVTSFKKSKWPMFDRAFAKRIKEEHPEIWAAGGNIKGNDQYEILTRIAEQGGVAKTPDQINALELREAWVARHAGDFRLPGVIAQIKWLAIGSRGEDHMKNVVNEAVKKRKQKTKTADISAIFDDEEQDEKAFGKKPGKEKLQALIEAVLKMDDEDMPEYTPDDEMEEKGPGWKLQRLLEMLRGDEDEDTMPRRPMMGNRECPCGCGAKIESEESMDDMMEGSDEEEIEDDEEMTPEEKVVFDVLGAFARRAMTGRRKPKPMSHLKSMDDDIEEKAGRVLSTNNMMKLQQAIELLQEVLASGGRLNIEMKKNGQMMIPAETDKLFAMKQHLEPVLDFYGAQTEIDEFGINVLDLDGNLEEFTVAIKNALNSLETK